MASTSFLPLVRQLAIAEGVAGLGVAEYAGTSNLDSAAVMEENFRKKTFEEIVRALTMKPTAGAVSPPRPASDLEQAVFTGTLEAVNEFYFNSQWTDGLAIIPPTRERVQEFLKYTDHPTHERVAVLLPANLTATPWNIAVNGVMAGCRPEHMPVLIAAVEAIGDPHYDLEQIGTTSGSNPFFIVNGPIIKQLGFESGTALISRGVNPAIGRALGLIVRNIAGFRPAQQYMGTFGYILPFVLAEDEERSPWEPFHVTRGFDRNASTVTASATLTWGRQAFPSGTDVDGMLKIICEGIVNVVDMQFTSRFKDSQMLTVLITPSAAAAIARAGYSKKDLEAYLFEHSRVTMAQMRFQYRHGAGSSAGLTIPEAAKLGLAPAEWDDLGPAETLPVMVYPGLLHVVVCGDPTRSKSMALWSEYVLPTTKEIKLPANWDSLTAGGKKHSA